MKKFHQAPLAVLLTVSLLVLAGCSKPVLDYRNADLPDGLIYAQGANEPFTGTVTHVPDSFMFNSDAKGYWQLLRASGTSLAMISPSLLCTISVRHGYVDGEASCYLPRTDTKVIEASFDGGNLSGDLVYYNAGKSDRPWIEGSFDEGLPDGTEKVYSASTGKLIKKIPWSDGTLDGDYYTYNQSNGNTTLEGSFDDGKRSGTWKTFTNDGEHLINRVHYNNDGQLDGQAEGFDPNTGKRTFLVHWVNGKIDGEKKTWDKEGNLLTDETYTDGKKVAERKIDHAAYPSNKSLEDRMVQALSGPSANTLQRPPSPTSIDECVQGWVNANHAAAAKAGVDATATIDQVNEWEEWCKSGKQAPGAGS
ncbi:toxin-antitoxin system YwqK family antitoxin [Oleiagrimonas sp. MCCC 1A03011]|uniref:toxin-antitoxin system YwqK family antitoxin n=1 Tax=Oleiagrimonas sp. MCCC 1A03011 TaxID=1926883 RepID=UPI0011BF7413|nr:toxin-antitoxin system YwqK family antitoxin [Oleiagrimonas sp. MCCC 1A03011]